MIQSRKEKIASNIITLIFIILALFCVVPIFYILAASLSDEITLSREGYSLLPRGFSLEAFRFVLESPKAILNAYAVTIFVTIVGTVVSLLFTAMFAYVIARKDFSLSRIFSFMVFFSMLFNGGLVPTYIMMTQYYNVKDTVLALIIPYIIMPWHVFLMKGFLADIPVSLIEAAKIDGASEIKTFFKIVLPITKPALATVGLFIAFTYWNDWYQSMLYIDKALLNSLQFYLYRIMNNIQYLSSSMMAGNISIDTSSMPSETARMVLCVLAAGPMLVIFPFFQKYFVKGLTVGAVKG
ncbi:MAG TPA: carbohydrate ABC transporter permease [Clostridiales bacterium]|nr:carbohydrate ABC transporter permease [Clostridiales bacterium]